MLSERESVDIADLLQEIEADVVGIARLSDFKGSKLEETALRLLPEARSVVVFGMEVYPEILDLASPETVMGAASLNDLLVSNADFINGRLTKAAYDVARASRNLGLKALPLPATGCPLDSRFLGSVFSYKHAGEAAGVGKIGWNSMLITPDFGPRVRLACCLTEAELQPVNGQITGGCNGCGLCIDVCPVRALSMPPDGEPYIINKFACSTYYSAAGGCSECVRVCPIGR